MKCYGQIKGRAHRNKQPVYNGLLAEHGTIDRYRQGCNCNECIKAYSRFIKNQGGRWVR